MTTEEKNIIAGHAEFHNAVRPLMAELIDAEKTAVATSKNAIGDYPIIADYEAITQQEQEAMDAYNLAMQPIQEQERKIIVLEVAYGNKRRNAANDFFNAVANELENSGALDSISRVEATTESVQNAVNQISNQALIDAVYFTYNY
jgi:hypothetical protein